MIKRVIYPTTFFLTLLAASSCSLFKKPPKKVDNDQPKEVNVTFQVGSKTLDLKQLKASCAIVDSIQSKVPEDFDFIDFFHIYLRFASFKPESLKYFECGKKLENIGTYMLALDREPLSKIDFTSSIDVHDLHREIIRNLYKSVGAVRDSSSKYLKVSGISIAEGRIFDSSSEELIAEVTDPKLYVKYYSYLDDKSGTYQDFFIPIRNYELIKEYLLKISAIEKSAKHQFGMSYSALLYLLSLETPGKIDFAWIDEIRYMPYYSAVHPLARFMMQDKTLDNPTLKMGYSFTARLYSSGVLLANLIKETGILPKNFSALPIIEKSLESGDREYCGTIHNATDLLLAQKLYNNKLKVPKAFLNHCIGNSAATSPTGAAKPQVLKSSPNEFKL